SYKPSDIEDPKLREAVEWFAGNAIHNGPKQNFLLYGPVGTGKTVSALTCGYLVVKNSALSVRFVSHGYYLAALRPNGPIPPGLTVNTFRNRYLSADVLVLDDLGAARAMGVAAREWVVEQTFDLI